MTTQNYEYSFHYNEPLPLLPDDTQVYYFVGLKQGQHTSYGHSHDNNLNMNITSNPGNPSLHLHHSLRLKRCPAEIIIPEPSQSIPTSPPLQSLPPESTPTSPPLPFLPPQSTPTSPPRSLPKTRSQHTPSKNEEPQTNQRKRNRRI